MRCPLCNHTEFGEACCGNVKCLNCGAELAPDELDNSEELDEE